MAHLKFRRWFAIPVLAVATLVVTGCGSSAQPADSASAGQSASGSTAATLNEAASTDPGEVHVSVTEADGCVATPDRVPAGAVTFVVTNVDSLAVTEVELVADQRIVGERENLAPGFDSTFSARLDGESYQISRATRSTVRARPPSAGRSPSPARRPRTPATSRPR